MPSYRFGRGGAPRLRGPGNGDPVPLPRLVWHNRRRYGGHIVHIGVVLLAMGIAASHMFSTSVEKTVAPGESIEVRDYTVTFRELKESAGCDSLRGTGMLDG